MNPTGVFFAAIGVFVVVAAIGDWEWFMNHRKSRFWISIIGRQGTRVLFALIGVVVLTLGVGIAMGYLGTKPIGQ